MASDIFEEIVRLRRERVPAALATVVATKGSTPAKVPTRMLVTFGGRHLEPATERTRREPFAVVPLSRRFLLRSNGGTDA